MKEYNIYCTVNANGDQYSIWRHACLNKSRAYLYALSTLTQEHLDNLESIKVVEYIEQD